MTYRYVLLTKTYRHAQNSCLVCTSIATLEEWRFRRIRVKELRRSETISFLFLANNMYNSIVAGVEFKT